MRQRIALMFGVSILLILILFFLTKPESVTQVSGPFYKDAANLQQSMTAGNHINFFTGASFADLDLATGETQSLSDYFYTKGAVNVSSWASGSVLFSTNGTDGSDTFGQEILKAGKTSEGSASYWWRYDFQSRKLQLLDFDRAENCTSFNEIGRTLICIMSHNGSAHSYDIYGYSLDSSTWRKLSDIDQAVSEASASDSSIFYITTDLSGRQSLWAFSPSGAGSKLVYKSSQQFNYVTDGTKILVDEIPIPNTSSINNSSASPLGTKVVQKLSLLDISGKPLAHIGLSGGTGQFAQVGGSLSYTLPDGNVFIAPAGHTSINRYHINQPNIASSWQTDGTTYFLDTHSNLMASKKLMKLKGPDRFIETYNVSPNTFYINVVGSGQNTVYLNDSSKPFVTNAAGVANWLRSIGFDPNQFSFNWQLLNVSDAYAVLSNSVILR